MTPEAMAKTLALITPTTTYDGFDNVDIVVEAVFENMDLKKIDVRRARAGDAARLPSSPRTRRRSTSTSSRSRAAGRRR